MRLSIGDWPPILSHCVTFILGVVLVIFTMEDQVIPLKISPGHIIFSISKVTIPESWRRNSELKNIAGKLVRIKTNEGPCLADEVPVTVLSTMPAPILLTKTQFMMQVHRILSRPKQGHETQLVDAEGGAWIRCDADRISVNE